MQELRREARRLENELDLKLVSYSRLDASDASASASADEIERQIDALLARLAECNDRMSREAADAAGSATTMHTLQRHREILHDFTQEFRKTKANLRSADERQRLLSSVRQDSREQRNGSVRATDTLLRERNAIHVGDRMADEVLGQAQATREALGAQRQGFGSTASKLSLISSLAPRASALIGAIGRRQKRDKMILALVFGLCLGFFIIYAIG
ncbi:hypothetical protein AB1Y20_007197 [Prymnesium parvum]|uniref:Golgi SNAP receptor complex member 1 n=1 Tax=Prymnesium parvum TaxID=97485 RepID=A0AB34IUA6_PRYPA